jgi:hypothetical protein
MITLHSGRENFPEAPCHSQGCIEVDSARSVDNAFVLHKISLEDCESSLRNDQNQGNHIDLGTFCARVCATCQFSDFCDDFVKEK